VNIPIVEGEADDIPDGEVVIATGPLTSDAMAARLTRCARSSTCIFTTPWRPIVTLESVDMDSAFFASRYDKGTADYVNCPMTRDEYDGLL
jgi:methylenetetrahydrofolate--tRNA-(uracil-5-)-methyltransferase